MNTSQSANQYHRLPAILIGLLCGLMAITGCTSVVVKPIGSTKFPEYPSDHLMPIYTTIGIGNAARVQAIVGQPLLPHSSMPPHTKIGTIAMNPPALFGLGSICR